MYKETNLCSFLEGFAIGEKINVKIGDKVNQGDLILNLKIGETSKKKVDKDLKKSVVDAAWDIVIPKDFTEYLILLNFIKEKM